jgi:drug/metabolite transporter (DMT)-like permease
MLIEVLSKLLSDSLLSLYPIFVKYINLPIGIQVWSRFFTYVAISIFLINWSYISKYFLSKNALLLSGLTMLHVYTSYRGFQLLDSGVAYVLFYTYPLMILLLAGEKLSFVMLFALLGVFLLSSGGGNNTVESFDKYNNNIFKKREEVKENTIKENFKYEGLVMIILAALTEALIYFVVRNLKTDNNWNHLFISYGIGAILLSIYYFKDIKDTLKNTKLINTISSSIFINLFLGLFGNFLRFFAISRLNANIYAPLSYFGILMAYIYGVFINKDVITIRKVIGTICIIIPNLYFIITQTTH